jgi:hypothetical protein
MCFPVLEKWEQIKNILKMSKWEKTTPYSHLTKPHQISSTIFHIFDKNICLIQTNPCVFFLSERN